MDTLDHCPQPLEGSSLELPPAAHRQTNYEPWGFRTLDWLTYGLWFENDHYKRTRVNRDNWYYVIRLCR